MPSTVILFAAFLVLFVVGTVVWALLLKFGLIWARVPGGTSLRVAIVAGMVLALHVTIGVGVGLIIYRLSAPRVVMQSAAFLGFGLYFVGSWLLIARVFGVGLSIAIKAWAPTLLTPLFSYSIYKAIYVPLLFEAFVIPTNSMAPTVIGVHVEGKCPTCGAKSFGSAEPREFGRTEPARLICSRFHSYETLDYDETERSSDRIMTAKLLAPRRWDLVVFRNPDDEEQNYLKRLIGLPGETVTIVDGSIFINGTKLEPPPELSGIQYVTKFDEDRHYEPPAVWGSVKKPAVLGPDEFFVLGDHSLRALDSRLWQRGAPGHPTYAVPRSYMIGVATHIYWPPERLRVFR